MIFTVPEDFKGSFVLNTLNKALSGGMSVSIYGNDLYAPDVKMAIGKGVLVPDDGEYDKKMASLSNEAMIVNRTDRVLVLGEIILRPWASLLVNKNIANGAVIQSAAKSGFVHVVSDEKSFSSQKFSKTSIKDEVKDIEDTKKTEFVPGAERQVKAKVWNFREQESEDASVVPTTPDMIDVTEEPEPGDIDFIDKPVKTKKTVAKKKSTKRSTKKSTKKTVKKASDKKEVKNTIKKKGKAAKKAKVKSIEPVGDKRIPKTSMDAAIELDSRGRPIENASDVLNHLIDSLNLPDEISFVDDEQAQDRYENRTDLD